MLKNIIILIACLMISGCNTEGSKTVKISSQKISTLNQKILTLEKYVTFRKSYQKLDFVIDYHDNSGGLISGPSDWDIRIVAMIPKHEIEDWTKDLKPSKEQMNANWLASLNTEIDYHNINQWYRIDQHRLLGIDKKSNVIAYRNRSY